MTMHGIYPHADDSASNIGADLGSASEPAFTSTMREKSYQMAAAM
jgi:hypothetical protein